MTGRPVRRCATRDNKGWQPGVARSALPALMTHTTTRFAMMTGLFDPARHQPLQAAP